MRFILFLFMLLPVCVSAQVRVATSDWAVAQTLTAIGNPPVALSEKMAYRYWVKNPPLPAGVVDSGGRMAPNLELLAQVKPAFFLNPPFYDASKAQLSRIAPVYPVPMTDAAGYSWAQMTAVTRQIGNAVGRKTEAEQLIRDTAASLERNRLMVKGKNYSVLVFQFIDSRHVRLFGTDSMFQVALDKMGVKNAWGPAGNEWGIVTVPFEALVRLPEDTVMVIIKPYPAYVPVDLRRNALWKRLPAVHSGRLLILPPCWSFGGLTSVSYFGNKLAEALVSGKGEPW